MPSPQSVAAVQTRTWQWPVATINGLGCGQGEPKVIPPAGPVLCGPSAACRPARQPGQHVLLWAQLAWAPGLGGLGPASQRRSLELAWSWSLIRRPGVGASWTALRGAEA